MDIHSKGYQSTPRIRQWKKFAKRLFLVVAVTLQLLHAGQQLVALKHPTHKVSRSEQAVFMLKQCFNFNCQFLVSLGGRSRKMKRKNS